MLALYKRSNFSIILLVTYIHIIVLGIIFIFLVIVSYLLLFVGDLAIFASFITKLTAALFTSAYCKYPKLHTVCVDNDNTAYNDQQSKTTFLSAAVIVNSSIVSFDNV